MTCLQLLHVEIFQTLMGGKFTSLELLRTNLALYLHFWTVVFYVLPQLAPRKMLKLFKIANIASEFRTLVTLDVLL